MTPGDSTLLNDPIQEKIKDLGEVDILVGIPSYNNSRTIAHVVRAVNAGLAKYYPNAKSVLVNSDGGSKDNTPDLVSQTNVDNLEMILVDHPVYFVSKIITPYHGIPGKGRPGGSRTPAWTTGCPSCTAGGPRSRTPSPAPNGS